MDRQRRRARLALDGLALGDAFGERYFVPPETARSMIERRALPAQPVWKWTDDTEMACAIFDVLVEHGELDAAALAAEFARRYARDRMRGYGRGAHELLSAIDAGENWEAAARSLFGGQGSYGNGGAMRVAPLGAWFADDLDRAAAQAAKSALPTHRHPEGAAGAIAVAVATAVSWQLGQGEELDFFDEVLRRVPDGLVHDNVADAATLGDVSVDEAVAKLGNGSRVTAQDTVGFALWSAHQHLDDYEEALWNTVAGLGDRDTTCAMVGGIVAVHVGRSGLPGEWLEHLEPLALSNLALSNGLS
jgi:ADP-ribosylglycohydrolase